MSVFLDSSALVKLYSYEPGSDRIAEIDEALCLSAICLVELPSALNRKALEGALSQEERATLESEFQADLTPVDDDPPRFQLITLNNQVLVNAVELVKRHQLRSLDAIQLSTATLAREIDPNCKSFGCFDVRLREAALSEGFQLIPESL